MSETKPVLLVVDDEPINLLIITDFLEDMDYELVTADGGIDALDKLYKEPEKFDAVLLDRMMPDLDGMEVLQKIKQHPQLKLLPVIFQTAAIAPEQVAEGLKAGAFYYLTKPFKSNVLKAVVANALRDRIEHLMEHQDAEARKLAMNFLDEANFSFRTTTAARQIAALISYTCPSRQSAYVGLMELMLNAIEHGNLGITYDEKTHLISDNKLHTEIERRLNLPEYAEKFATLTFRRSGKSLIFTIKDQGNGFDWQQYLEMNMERLMDNHGRGIAMSRSLAFTQLEYFGNGNAVQATIIV